MEERKNIFHLYPSAEEIDRWADNLFQEASDNPAAAEKIEPDELDWPNSDNLPYRYAARHHTGSAYVRFSYQEGRAFYCFWQPVFGGGRRQAPLLIHVPGYGGEMSAHPELVSAGYNVLHINPLGYCTPESMDDKELGDPEDPLSWPQLPDTITSYGEKGYRQWFRDCINAVSWALKQPEVLPGRFSFFGTSQGGGGSLILGSLFSGKGVRAVAADLPYLTNFPLADGRGAYEIAAAALEKAGDRDRAWKALGYVDTFSHTHRLTMPVLLTAGGADEMCPPDTVFSLFERLDTIKSYTFLKESEHEYTPEFLSLAKGWFDLYA